MKTYILDLNSPVMAVSPSAPFTSDAMAILWAEAKMKLLYPLFTRGSLYCGQTGERHVATFTTDVVVVTKVAE